MLDKTDARNRDSSEETLVSDSPFYPVARERLALGTRRCVVFLDTSPVSKRHALVVARSVTASLFDLSLDVQAELWETVRRAREILMERFHPDGFNIGLNDGAEHLL